VSAEGGAEERVTAAVDAVPSVRGEPARRQPGRAGRNLPAAIGVGLALALLVLVPLFSPWRWLFVGVLIAAAAVGTFEVVGALRRLGLRPPLVPLLACGPALLVAAYAGGPDPLVVALVLSVLACLGWRLLWRSRDGLRDVAAAAFTAAYVPFLAGFAALLAQGPDGPRRVVVFIFTVVCSDVGGYAAGVLFG
jgi:phosphatidate cytidylyltransferase